VLVVDNGSGDGSLEWLRGREGLRLIEMGENRGFTGANLAGLAAARGSLIAALNNDTEPDPAWLGLAVAAFARDARIGTVASLLVEHARTDVVDSAGDGLNRAGRGVKIGSGGASASQGLGRYAFGACAAAALYRREMIDEVGFFEDAFFFNCEDVDLSARAQLKGWRCWYEPSARVRHHVSASRDELGAATIFYWSRNCELLWFRNMPLLLWPLLLPPKFLQECLSLTRNAFAGVHTAAYLKGKLAAFLMLKSLWPGRRRIQKGRVISALAFYALLGPSFDLPSLNDRARRLAATLRERFA
jgi:GT2 family glycosyltransferase